jgi:hypothetical protein
MGDRSFQTTPIRASAKGTSPLPQDFSSCIELDWTYSIPDSTYLSLTGTRGGLREGRSDRFRRQEKVKWRIPEETHTQVNSSTLHILPIGETPTVSSMCRSLDKEAFPSMWSL